MLMTSQPMRSKTNTPCGGDWHQLVNQWHSLNCFRYVISTETDNKQLETVTVEYHCHDIQMEDEFPCNSYVASYKNISLHC